VASRTRLDQRLVELGLAPSRAQAQALIMAGLARIDGQTARKPGQGVEPQAVVSIDGPEHPYVSRGGLKLAGALDYFGLSPVGLSCLDVGASTGGFTDCLLQRGAAEVTAVDVGYGQLAWKLRVDPRVKAIERQNVRHMAIETAPGPYGLIVMDVSFISLRLVLPNITPRLALGGRLLAMVKPQFEAGREHVGSGGVVRDAAARQQAVDGVADCMRELGLEVLDQCPSPILGPKGNVEIFLLAQKCAPSDARP